MAQHAGAGEPSGPPVRPEAAELYRGLATFRRVLLMDPDIPAEQLREMLGAALEAAELMAQSTEILREALVQCLATKP